MATLATVEELLAKMIEKELEWKEEWAKRDAEREAERARLEAERKAEMEAINKSLQNSIDRLTANQIDLQKCSRQLYGVTGALQKRFGELVELVLLPKLRPEINKYGHEFYVASPNKEFQYKDGNTMTEIDMLLENGEEALAVEIKANFRVKDINEHLRQLKLLRKHEEITGIKGKNLYAGIAGITITDKIRELAHRHGMYVINIREEEEKLDIEPPETKKRW